MKYVAYKLWFQTGVHFGNGMLNDTNSRFFADTLFSALCTEAVKIGAECLEKLYQWAKSGRIILSDGFPFIGDTLYVPRPMISIESGDDIANRKKWKKLKYVPVEQMGEYFQGNLNVEEQTEALNRLGQVKTRQNAGTIKKEAAAIYTIGIYHFNKGNGLYFILGYEEEEHRFFIEELLKALSYQGIGGRVSSGLGKFIFSSQELDENMKQRLEAKQGKFVLLTTSLPTEEELPLVLEEASYLLEKRGGFIQSTEYAEEMVKKQDLFFFKAGSVVKKRFQGDVYEVGNGGNHFVFRYGKPLLMEVSI